MFSNTYFGVLFETDSTLIITLSEQLLEVDSEEVSRTVSTCSKGFTGDVEVVSMFIIGKRVSVALSQETEGRLTCPFLGEFTAEVELVSMLIIVKGVSVVLSQETEEIPGGE